MKVLAPPDFEGPLRTSVTMLAVVPLVGNASLVSGYMILLHAVCIKVHAGKGTRAFLIC